MATPIIELPLGESNLNSDSIGETNEAKDIPLKIKSTKSVLNSSCLCLSVNGVCTCIHLNGNFNQVQIKNVLDLINTPLCEAGPSTSNYNSTKRRKLLSSESSDERLTVVESKKVCKALDSDDLDSDDCDDMENDNDYSTLKTSNLAKTENPSSTGTTVPPTSTTEPLSPYSTLSRSTLSSTTISSPSISSSNSSPARDGVGEDRTRSPDRSNLLSFIRIINSAFSEQDHGERDNSDETSNTRESDHDSTSEDDDDDDDDNWMGSLDSDSEQLDDVDTLPNPEVLNKPQPKHTWFPLQEIVQRQYGNRTKYQSPSLFQQRYYGSLHAVQRFELMYKLEKHHGCVNALDFHPSGHLLASASDDRKVVIWDWATGQPLYSYSSGHSSNVFQSKWLHLAGSSGFVVTSARDGLIRLADFGQISGSGGRSTQLIAKHKRSAHKLSVMKDTPHVILSVGEDGRVLSVDVRESCAANSKEILSLKKRKNSVLPLYSVASNPLNSYEFIVAGEDTQVHLFDRRFMFTKTAKPLKKFCPDTIKKEVHYYITCAVYNYSGTEILASYNDEKIYLFDSRATCVPDSTVTEYLHCYEGHRNSATVKGVNFFGPKSQYVVSGSDDGYIYIWDKNTEAIVNWMRGDDDGVVNCIEGHPDVPVLATSGLDSNVKIWVPSCEQGPTFKNLKKTVILNEKKRGRIHSSMGSGRLPIYSHFRWLWQTTFDSARSGDPLTMSREEGEEDSGDEDDPRQCAPS